MVKPIDDVPHSNLDTTLHNPDALNPDLTRSSHQTQLGYNNHTKQTVETAKANACNEDHDSDPAQEVSCLSSVAPAPHEALTLLPVVAHEEDSSLVAPVSGSKSVAFHEGLGVHSASGATSTLIQEAAVLPRAAVVVAPVASSSVVGEAENGFGFHSELGVRPTLSKAQLIKDAQSR